MSDPTKLQRRSPFRVDVRIRRNPAVSPILSQSSSSLVNGNDVKSECQISSENPQDFWSRLHEQLNNEPTTNRNNHGNQQNESNKIVRIFVSSTFTDFYNEREILIKKVVPELKDQLEPYGIQIIDCDLRWGVPKEYTIEQTILTCMEELDRCIKDNGQPFFIGLISDKYGWVPEINTLPKQLVERYRWIDGASITLMEFIHGAFRTHNPNAIFFIRNSQDIFKHLPERYLDKFRDRDESNQKQIGELKAQLPKMFPPEQIYHYDCFYNGLDSSTGRERVIIDGLQAFQDRVKEFLIDSIKKWYQDECQNIDSTDTGDKQMMNFLRNKTQFFIDCPNEFSYLNKYITGDHKDLNLIVNDEKTLVNHQQALMAVTGLSGAGKTMTLSKLVLQIKNDMRDNKCLLSYYFLDGAYQDNSSYIMRMKLTQDLNKYLQENNIVSSQTGSSLQIDDENFISQAISLIPIPIILVFDGLDRGDLHQQRNYNHEFPFSILSDLLSDHTYICISCQPNSSLHRCIRSYSHYQCELEHWNAEKRRSYIELFFRRFNKTLDAEQTNLLVENSGGENPFYLSCVCENLRQFGDYSLVTQRLKTYPSNMNDLYKFLMDEAYTLFNNRTVLDTLLKLLLVSEVGLIETDIVHLLRHHVNGNSDDDEQIKINTMTWSTLPRHMKIFLDTTWIYGHQLIVFRHSSIEKLVQTQLFKGDDTEEKRPLHRFLGEYYIGRASSKEFAFTRVPFHFEQALMYKEMINFICQERRRPMVAVEHRPYLQRRRCKKILYGFDGIMNQRAYVCDVCAIRLGLNPYMTTRSSCAICTDFVHLITSSTNTNFRHEARLCQKHGFSAYPAMIHCMFCRRIRIKQRLGTVTSSSPVDPGALHICTQCWLADRGANRCCGLEIE